MHSYQHHIGDFNNATRHLDRLERSIYRDLIELYYSTESPLSLDIALLCRKIIARSEQEATAVQQVLNEFFTETEHGWEHNRCEHEIEKYRSNTTAKAMAGKASAAAKKQKRQSRPIKPSTPVEQTLNECATELQQNSTNHKPETSTINHNQVLNTYCSEPIVSEPAVIEPAVIEILTNKKNELAKITHSQYDRWVETYPAVDVWQTLLRIKSWAENNPAKRKTSKGMARFIDSWLAREQDKPRLNPGGPGGAPQGQFKNSREKNAERNKEIFDYNRAIDF